MFKNESVNITKVTIYILITKTLFQINIDFDALYENRGLSLFNHWNDFFDSKFNIYGNNIKDNETLLTYNQSISSNTQNKGNIFHNLYICT